MNSSGVPVQLAHSVDMDTLCLQTRMYNNLAGQFSWNCPGASNIYDMPTVLQQGQVLTTVDFSPAMTFGLNEDNIISLPASDQINCFLIT